MMRVVVTTGFILCLFACDFQALAKPTDGPVCSDGDTKQVKACYAKFFTDALLTDIVAWGFPSGDNLWEQIGKLVVMAKGPICSQMKSLLECANGVKHCHTVKTMVTIGKFNESVAYKYLLFMPSMSYVCAEIRADKKARKNATVIYGAFNNTATCFMANWRKLLTSTKKTEKQLHTEVTCPQTIEMVTKCPSNEADALMKKHHCTMAKLMFDVFRDNHAHLAGCAHECENAVGLMPWETLRRI